MHALCYPLPLCTLASDAVCTVRGHRTALGCSPSVHFRRRLLLPYTYSCDSKVTDPSSSSTQSKIQLYFHCTRTPLPTIAPWVHSHWGCGSSCGRSSPWAAAATFCQSRPHGQGSAGKAAASRLGAGPLVLLLQLSSYTRWRPSHVLVGEHCTCTWCQPTQTPTDKLLSKHYQYVINSRNLTINKNTDYNCIVQLI